MTKRADVLLSLCFLAIGMVPSTARASVYLSQNAPVNLWTLEADPKQEISSALGGLNPYPLIAAGRMGLKFLSNTSTTESSLLNSCVQNSPPTSWKGGCDIGGLTTAMSLSSPNQLQWDVWTYPKTSEATALAAIIDGLKLYKSPVLVPLYGHATHWGTIYKIQATNSELEFVEWFDSGPLNISDGDGASYNNGVQGFQGDIFKILYHEVLTSTYLSNTDPYRDQFVVAYDPPVGVTADSEIRRVSAAGPMRFSVAPGVIGPGERMTVDVAHERVWNALLTSNVPQSQVIWPAIEYSTVGSAWLVHSVTRSGAPYDYFIVSLLNDKGDMIGLVKLSGTDGAFQQIWVGVSPSPFIGVTLEEATSIASSMLGDNEQLAGGELMWDPSFDEPIAPSPLFPFYEYRIMSAGASCGSLLVMLRDGEVRFHPTASNADCVAG